VSEDAPVFTTSTPLSAYAELFVDQLAQQLERAPKPLIALDFACGRGISTRALHRKLPPGSRVVAIDQDRGELNIFHQELDDSLRSSIFIRKDSAPRLPFAESAFDLAWASLATSRLQDEPKQVLRQVVRSLRPPGQVLLATPLRETVVELRSAITPVIQSEDHSAVRALLQEDTQLASSGEWQEAFSKAGAADVGAARATFVLRIEKPVAQHPIFAQYVLPMWLYESNPYRKQVLAQLDARLEAPLDIRVHVACIYGRRGRSA